MKKHKRMYSFWEQLFEKIRKFPRKTSRWNCFLNKVAGCLTLTGKVLLRNLWKFQNKFHKKLPRMSASAISCCWKMFQPKDIFFKISFDLYIQWHVLPGIKWQQTFKGLSWCLSWFALGLFSFLLFMLYSSVQAAMSRALSRLHIKLFFLDKKFQGGG